MMGCGTGAILEPKYTDQLPPICNHLTIKVEGEPGTTPSDQRRNHTQIVHNGSEVLIQVGDSRRGWVDSYQALLALASNPDLPQELSITVDLNDIRPSGEQLKGFGGVANPIKLPSLYARCVNLLNKAIGRKLNPIECCLLIDEAASTIVAGNIRRSAGMRQFDCNDPIAATAKENLWMQDDQGNWRVDPERDPLRMANHTHVFHRKPTLEETIKAVTKQFHSGEGAIQWAGEAIARGNRDLMPDFKQKQAFLDAYVQGNAAEWIQSQQPDVSDRELDHRLGRYGLNPCVTADTWIHTEDGPRQVKDLIGVQHGTYVNGELFSTTPEGFFFTGTKPVFRLTTQEGHTLKLTEDHQVLKVSAQTQKAQYTEWVEAKDLKPGDQIRLHNHRDLQPWQGNGTHAEGWLLGSFVGDGCFAQNESNYLFQAQLRYWGEDQLEMKEYALGLVKASVAHSPFLTGTQHAQNGYSQVASAGLAKLALAFGIIPGKKTISDQIESAGYTFYQGFLQGLFDADGSVQGNQEKGISVRLSQSNLSLLQATQRMLLRIGIVSTIYTNRRDESYRMMPDSNRQLAAYYCQAQHELVIANDNLTQFDLLIGFQDPCKSEKLRDLISQYKRKPNRERFTAVVASLDFYAQEKVYDCTVPGPHCFDANGLIAHNCGEIIGADFFCNLSEIHLNQLDPQNFQEQEDAFSAGALSVAVLLNHQFQEERYRYSRQLDPIVGVSFTGLFDFFVHAFGMPWLQWWEQGRPETTQGLEFKLREQAYLNRWRDHVHQVIWDYCDRHGLRRPNRCTTVQPAGTKSLLTNASPGWHPPKAQRYIRRITFAKNDPIALACLDYGYSIVPSQSDKDENGRLLDDPFDPRCTEWLVEIPVEVSWANVPGADSIAIEKFSALAQFDFYMQVQRHWTTHNTSATIELTADEIDPLAQRIYRSIAEDEGYMSAALLARFDAPFPRLPFEKIDQATFDQLSSAVLKRRRSDDFQQAVINYDLGYQTTEGPAGCDAMGCLLPEAKPES